MLLDSIFKNFLEQKPFCVMAGANLYNRDGLPASPFRTDEW